MPRYFIKRDQCLSYEWDVRGMEIKGQKPDVQDGRIMMRCKPGVCNSNCWVEVEEVGK